MFWLAMVPERLASGSGQWMSKQGHSSFEAVHRKIYAMAAWFGTEVT